jgi:probable rRNA maturation factor
MNLPPVVLCSRRGRLGSYAPSMATDAMVVLRITGIRMGLGPLHELSLLLCDNPTIARLNRRWRAKDRPTDVLSFPLSELEAGQQPPEGPLGDIVISLPMARLEARYDDERPGDCLARLLIHGLLHLLGYDHEERADQRRMSRRESQLLREIQTR